jgi:osmotically-inducible protein OsmY
MRKMGKSNDMRAAVIDDRMFDPDVDASAIRVEMDGDVMLTGSVPSYPQYVQAAAAAARAAGVRYALILDGAVSEGVEATAKDGDITLTGVRRVKNDIQIRDLEQA